VPVGEAVASEFSRVLSSYGQHAQKLLQAYLGQVGEQWQAAFQVYTRESTTQWQEAVRARAVERTAADLEAKLMALSSSLSATVERLAKELNKSRETE
jgi:hypothetical protein